MNVHSFWIASFRSRSMISIERTLAVRIFLHLSKGGNYEKLQGIN